MPWRLIAKAFGWRAATDEDGVTPHPRRLASRGLDGISPVPTPGSAPCGSPSTRRNLTRSTADRKEIQS